MTPPASGGPNLGVTVARQYISCLCGNAIHMSSILCFARRTPANNTDEPREGKTPTCHGKAGHVFVAQRVANAVTPQYAVHLNSTVGLLHISAVSPCLPYIPPYKANSIFHGFVYCYLFIITCSSETPHPRGWRFHYSSPMSSRFDKIVIKPYVYHYTAVKMFLYMFILCTATTVNILHRIADIASSAAIMQNFAFLSTDVK